MEICSIARLVSCLMAASKLKNRWLTRTSIPSCELNGKMKLILDGKIKLILVTYGLDYTHTTGYFTTLYKTICVAGRMSH